MPIVTKQRFLLNDKQFSGVHRSLAPRFVPIEFQFVFVRIWKHLAIFALLFIIRTPNSVPKLLPPNFLVHFPANEKRLPFSVGIDNFSTYANGWQLVLVVVWAKALTLAAEQPQRPNDASHFEACHCHQRFSSFYLVGSICALFLFKLRKTLWRGLCARLYGHVVCTRPISAGERCFMWLPLRGP